jgi:hypothetical protein
MDSDKQQQKDKPRSSVTNIINDWNVFQSIRLRYPFLFSNETHKFLLDYNVSFLPGVSIMLWCLLLFA